ncbi:hypothetical protein BDQ94DRAFT_155787 [Aspergillus welwitschiae]|uniref:Uncharacterized protein n=1 Tax=Aspergillus welwitschiae TaxID=1341132 RepID=A0A3F3PH58_9EURO|nr:hypothetical protein BDQ94DRAFT_155787 [Aspergillus welwitschiae]RDH26275.1 hypothetical protein BDQ94DRAFT_155787 [Aspergillus welwitschiae]
MRLLLSAAAFNGRMLRCRCAWLTTSASACVVHFPNSFPVGGPITRRLRVFTGGFGNLAQHVEFDLAS